LFHLIIILRIRRSIIWYFKFPRINTIILALIHWTYWWRLHTLWLTKKVISILIGCCRNHWGSVKGPDIAPSVDFFILDQAKVFHAVLRICRHECDRQCWADNNVWAASPVLSWKVGKQLPIPHTHYSVVRLKREDQSIIIIWIKFDLLITQDVVPIL